MQLAGRNLFDLFINELDLESCKAHAHNIDDFVNGLLVDVTLLGAMPDLFKVLFINQVLVAHETQEIGGSLNELWVGVATVDNVEDLVLVHPLSDVCHA